MMDYHGIALEILEDNFELNDIFTVWMCKTLQNWKGIFGAPKQPYLFEVTYSGDKDEWYVDRYVKLDNRAIKFEEL